MPLSSKLRLHTYLTFIISPSFTSPHETNETANTTSAIEKALAPTKASGSNGVINLSPVGRKELASYALTPGLDDIPFSFEDGGASAGGSQKVKSPLGGSD